MTGVPVDNLKTLRRLLADTEALLLDFDGPVCSVFAGFPAQVVANQLRELLVTEGRTAPPHSISKTTDPFDVLKYAATLGMNEARYTEAAFRAHEVEAISTAVPTQGAHELIERWHATGRPLGIVSNNSVAAIESYLSLHNIRNHVDVISARNSARIDLLKPNTHLIISALEALQVNSNKAMMVGDSPTDIEAAEKAKIRSIGFANKRSKLETLTTGSTFLITSMTQLLCAIDQPHQ